MSEAKKVLDRVLRFLNNSYLTPETLELSNDVLDLIEKENKQRPIGANEIIKAFNREPRTEHPIDGFYDGVRWAERMHQIGEKDE